MKLAIQFPRLGAYHLARIGAAHAYFSARGASVVALETAALDGLYEWRQEKRQTAFPRHQVFPGRNFHDLKPSAIRKGILDALDALDPDAVAIHSYGYPDGRAALAWCRRRRRIAIMMTDSRIEDTRRFRLRERIKARIVRQFDVAVVGGTAQRRYMEHLGFEPDRVWYGYNTVDNAYFAGRTEEIRRLGAQPIALPGLESPHPFFLASSRFLPRKNIAGLVRAYAGYRSRANDPWNLTILGDGVERAGVESVIASGRIEGVVLAGFRQIDELPEYYARAGAFIHAAFAEPWGLVVNEAMAAGLPMLASHGTGSAEDLVRPGENGYLFSAHDEASMADAMHRLAAHPAPVREAMGQRSRDLIRAWGTDRFASGLWEACSYMDTHALRRPDRFVDLLLGAIDLLAPRVDTLHTVEA